MAIEKSNMATRWPFWKWHIWKSIGFIPYKQIMCYWSLDLIFKAKLKLESVNWKIQHGFQTAILKVTSLKIKRLWPMATKQHSYKILNWNFKAHSSYAPDTMPPIKSRYRKIQYDRQAAILKVPLLKINRLLPIHTSNVSVKFGLNIQSQTKVRVRKP